MNSVRNLKPEQIWKHFAEILAIPRESKNEAQIRQYILDFAEKKGFKTSVDQAGNIVVLLPAAKDREDEQILVLQSHIDMVCVKATDKVIDFAKDPIPVKIEGDLLIGDGTTLGADNGIGVAIMLALIEDQSIDHGPLELLFTIDEEAGMTGAHHLTPDFFKGRKLLNLDTEEWGEFYISCAGGGDTVVNLPINRTELQAENTLYKLRIEGMKGGHSGVDINTGRGSAIKVLARFLWHLNREMPLDLVKIKGGTKRNVIPSDAEAIFTVASTSVEHIKEFLAPLEATIRNELGNCEPGLKVILEPVEASAGMRKLVHLSTEKVLDLLRALHHGVITMSPEVPGLVETSCNIGVLKCEDQYVALQILSRSAITSKVDDSRDSIEALVKLAGGTIERPLGYPGWKPNPASPILAEASAVFEKLFNQKPKVKAIHAGLECGIIGEKYPGIDMLSIGPDIKGAHTVGEQVSISSVSNFWTFLTAFLARR
ncbi:aminoacyl-histidine dipeptidase [bacterium]|nr:aminoacyl-histidine dipeptidase [bacterium]